MTDIGTEFRSMHIKGKPFIMSNVWDLGSAKLMVAMGAPALATSSAAQAFTLGRPDMGTLTRDEALTHAQEIVAAVNIPVSGDFENGFGDDPETVAETVRMAAEIGLAGCSIEDTNLPDTTPYEHEFSVERVRAAVSAARALPRDFVITARADGIMNGHYGVDAAIRRIQDFEEAGADCLYVPLPKTIDQLARVIAAVQAPVNVLVAGDYRHHRLRDFAAIGAARISLGSTLARVTHKAIVDAARAIYSDYGSFQILLPAANGSDIDELLQSADEILASSCENE